MGVRCLLPKRPFLMHPNPITTNDLLARTPYQTEAQAESRLENGVEHGIF